MIDVFPARFRAPAGPAEVGESADLRVLVTKERVLVYRIPPGKRDVELIRAAPLASAVRPGARPVLYKLEIAGDDGPVAWELCRGYGCGCSHPLKRVAQRALVEMA